MSTHTHEQGGSHILTPEMAVYDPEGFKDTAVEHMGTTTELGAFAWNHALDTGTLRLDQFSISPRSWASFSRPDGYLSLGVAPMSPQERERYLYLGEHMTYPDEVSRRLLHEVAHDGLFLAQHQPMMKALRQMTYDTRRKTQLGFTPLGSHPYYGNPEERATEDAVELVTMREIGADHLEGYLDILSAGRYEPLRQEMGLLRFEDKDTLRILVESATKEALTTNP